MILIPKKFAEFYKEIKNIDENDSVFGFFYKKKSKKETLVVNGGDWLENEIAEKIQIWGKENKVEIEFESEVNEDELLEQGYQAVVIEVDIKCFDDLWYEFKKTKIYDECRSAEIQSEFRNWLDENFELPKRKIK